jgi:ketosteroid isomerase-like protein
MFPAGLARPPGSLHPLAAERRAVRPLQSNVRQDEHSQEETPMMASDPLTDSDRSAISANMDRWVAAFTAADINGLLADAAPDVMVFPPNQPGVNGAVALRQWHEDQMSQTDITITHWHTEEIVGSGVFALQRFAYGLRVQPRAGGPAIEDRGMCFWIWRRESSGRWVIARSIWNSSNPLPA